MKQATTLVLLVLCGALCAQAKPLRTLVVLDSESTKQTHSSFFNGLSGSGHELDFALAEDSVELNEYGSWLYDNVILFAPSADSFAELEPSDLAAFVDAGGNLLAAASSDAGKALAELAGEFGVTLHGEGSAVVDHHAYDTSDPAHDHTLVASTAILPNKLVVGGAAASGSAVLFRGVGLSVSGDNILALRVLSGGDTTYSADVSASGTAKPLSIGADTTLVAAVQARNNARAVFSGSLDLFSDAFAAAGVNAADGSISAARSANAAFSAGVAAWAFQQSGVLRISNIRHHKADGSQPEKQLDKPDEADLPKSLFPEPEIARNSLVYRIKDDIYFAVDIEQFDGDSWKPFSADDVQLEFVMLDAYVRANLKPDGKGSFSTTFTAPDVYGVFKFRIMYRRPGYTTLESNTQVSVRPFRHNEYERFISSAYPYYASTFTMIGGLFIFSVVFLYNKDK